MDLKERDILGDALHEHWYYVSKGQAMLQLLSGYSAPEVLDVGAGSGFFSRYLLDKGVCKAAVCLDPGYETPRVETYAGGTLRFVQSIDLVNQRLILMMDVLEHVEDDLALLSKYTENLPAGSRVLVTVPAFQFLWSGHDEFLGHFRRYRIGVIENLTRRAGLRVLHCSYFFGALFPLVAAMRLYDRRRSKTRPAAPRSALRIAPAWLNSLLKLIHRLECVTLFRWNRIAGLSVFCLAEKP